MRKILLAILCAGMVQLATGQSSPIESPQGRPGIEIYLDDRNFFKENLSKEVEQFIAPSNELEETYKEFLKLPDSKIVKLFDSTCTSVYPWELSAVCSFGLLGNGGQYSFREKRYFFSALSDIQFADGRFNVAGILINGAFVDLGDIPIESVDQNTAGMEYLSSFVPAVSNIEADRQAKDFQKGVERGQWTYTRSLEAKENSVIGFRGIAYRSKAKTLSVDPRVDILVVFKIVEKTSDSVTIVWRKLRRTKAPKLQGQ